MTTLIDLIRDNAANAKPKPLLCTLGLHKNAERQHIRWDETRMNVCERCGTHTVALRQYK